MYANISYKNLCECQYASHSGFSMKLLINNNNNNNLTEKLI